MTHEQLLQGVMQSIAKGVPNFASLPQPVQEGLVELGAKYFREEYWPRLTGRINLDRYEKAMSEKTDEDKAFINENWDLLEDSLRKAKKAAQEELVSTFEAMMKKR